MAHIVLKIYYIFNVLYNNYKYIIFSMQHGDAVIYCNNKICDIHLYFNASTSSAHFLNLPSMISEGGYCPA